MGRVLGEALRYDISVGKLPILINKTRQLSCLPLFAFVFVALNSRDSLWDGVVDVDWG